MVEQARSWVSKNYLLLSIIGMFFVYLSSLVWTASKVESRVIKIEQWQEKREPIIDTLPVLREKLDQQMKILERIECGQKDINEKLWGHIVGERKSGKGE